MIAATRTSLFILGPDIGTQSSVDADGCSRCVGCCDVIVYSMIAATRTSLFILGPDIGTQSSVDADGCSRCVGCCDCSSPHGSAVYTVYLVIVHRRYAHIPQPKGAS